MIEPLAGRRVLKPIDPIENDLWAYVRGELADEEFENRLYSDLPALDAAFGESDASDLYSLDFKDPSPRSKFERKQRVECLAAKHFARECNCLGASDAFTRGDFSFRLFPRATVLAKRTPWISLERCEACGSHWMIGYDTVEDDVYFVRIAPADAMQIVTADRWPSNFDDNANLWPLTKT
jgi:hypothetical protein